MKWYDAKGWLKDFLDVASDQLHVHIGLAVFLAVALVLRRRRGAPIYAWLCVALVQAANEALDARDWIHWTGTINWPETIKDTVMTLFWPTVLVLIWRPLRRAGSVR